MLDCCFAELLVNLSGFSCDFIFSFSQKDEGLLGLIRSRLLDLTVLLLSGLTGFKWISLGFSGSDHLFADAAMIR